jgi:hypothetical protein
MHQAVGTFNSLEVLMRSNHLRIVCPAAALLAIMMVIGACSSSKKTTEPTDVIPPAAITSLATGTVTATSVVLSWTAPGNDGSTGTASQYDLRFSTQAITVANFASGTRVNGVPAPTSPGTSQTMTVTGLSANTPYYFAIKTADAVPNWSAISNVPHVTTAQGQDTTPPATVTTLAAGTITATSVVLTWAAPGNDGDLGTASQYDIRYSTSPITEANFLAAAVVAGAPAPTVAGSSQSVTVTALSPATSYYFALRAADAIPNWSGLSNVAHATTTGTGEQAPAAITNLHAVVIDSTEVELSWTAPGDDDPLETGHRYDVRRSGEPITEANFSTATMVTGIPLPAATGTAQSMRVEHLASGHDYYFAIKTVDEVPTASAISNVVFVRTPAAVSFPPGLVAPEFPDTVCINSANQDAIMAKVIAQSQLGMVNVFSQLAGIFFGPLGGAVWQHSGDCWDYTYNYAGCTGVYRACQAGSEYTYTMTLNGTCGGESHTNWIAYRIIFNIDHRTERFYSYESNTANVGMAWVRTWAADTNSGTLTIYNGDPDLVAAYATLDWSRSADKNTYDMTWIQEADSKWVSHFVKNPCSGTVLTYQWNSVGGVWWKEYDIAWTSGNTGHFDTYDETEALVTHRTW